MNISSANVSQKKIEITRPYAISYKSSDAVDLAFVRLETKGGITGYGCASPDYDVTGETFAACMEALHRMADRLSNEAADDYDLREELLSGYVATPAALAAIDMALWDICSKSAGKPLVDVFGRHHRSLPTSITIGIKTVEETLEEAREYAERGFRIIKLKLGYDLEENIERSLSLHEFAKGKNILLRVDFNQALTLENFGIFLERTSSMTFDLMEQPFPAKDLGGYRDVARGVADLIALDETVVSVADATRVVAEQIPAGIINIKLMKCGGVTLARRMGAIADKGGMSLMWGCMDESVISIAAGLHAAFSCPNTKYLDLDGSLDLASDYARGGFVLKDGMMSLTDKPGLGVELLDMA